MNRRFISAILLIVILTINCLSTMAYGNDKRITKDKAIEIANDEVEKLGLDHESLKVEATKYNTPWNKYLPKDDKEYAVDRKKLKNKQYWAVYYYNPMYKKGGDLCIFIDYNNGKVINKIRWR